MIGRAGVGVDNVDVDAATRRGHRRRERARVDGHLGGRAHGRRCCSRSRATSRRRTRRSRRDAGSARASAASSSPARRSACSASGASASRSRGARSGSRCASSRTTRSSSKERFRELGVERVETPDELYAAADFVTLHLPLDDGDARARSAPTRSRRCATASGSSTRRAASSSTRRRSLEALRSGKVAAAALDVFSDGAVLRAAARARQRRRDAAPRRVDRGGAGSRGRDRRRADRRRARGRARHERGEHPDAARRGLEALAPYVPLAAKLGRLAMELARGRAERIELTYYGALSQYDTRLLTVAALNGAFQGRTDQPVNYVNAPLDRRRARASRSPRSGSARRATSRT